MNETKSLSVPYNKYIKSFNLEYISTLGKTKELPKEFVRDLLSDDELFEYVKSVVDSNHYRVDVYIDCGTRMRSANYIVNVSDLLVLWSRFSDLSLKEIERYNYISKKSNLDSLKDFYKDQKLNLTINKKDYQFNCNDLIEVFFSDEKKFMDYLACNNILGYDKRIFFYAVNRFLRRENIMERYSVDRIYLKRNIKLRNQEIVDYQSIEALDVKNNLTTPIILNEEMKKKIFSHMSDDYNDLEKALYIYIKMCMMFSYDYKYLVDPRNEENFNKHMDPYRIEKIKSSDDLIVCYEFVFMYAKFLEELGIDYVIYSKGAGMHAHLNFIYDEYIVFADAVSSVFSGDLINAKFRLKLNGIKCINKSKYTEEKFKKILKRVYLDALNDEMEGSINTDEAVSIYRSIRSSQDLYWHLPLKERIDILFDQLQYVKCHKVDVLGYFSTLRAVLFSQEELDKNVNMLVLVNEHNPFIIITRNDNDYNKDEKSMQYYYFIVGKSTKIKKITKHKLLDLLEKKIIRYIPRSVNRIPGVGEGRK